MHHARQGAGDYFGSRVSETRYVGRRTKADVLDGVTDEIKTSKCEGRNTVRYHTVDGDERLRYHDTDVVTIYADKSVTLHSGGWRTVTTKERMVTELRRLGIRIGLYADKGQWWVSGLKGSGDAPVKDIWSGSCTVYVDGITFQPDGTLITADAELIERAQAEVEVLKVIKKLCAKLRKDLTDGELPKPEPGDCFICQTAKSGGPAHVQAHVLKGEINGHLIVAALRWCGWTEDSIDWTYRQWSGRGSEINQIVDKVRRYFRSAFGLTL